MKKKLQKVTELKQILFLDKACSGLPKIRTIKAGSGNVKTIEVTHCGKSFHSDRHIKEVRLLIESKDSESFFKSMHDVYVSPRSRMLLKKYELDLNSCEREFRVYMKNAHKILELMKEKREELSQEMLNLRKVRNPFNGHRTVLLLRPGQSWRFCDFINL